MMNERIQELIGQAQKEVWGNNPYNGSPEFEGYELDAEKFAELIVAECVELVSATRDLAIEDGWKVDEAMSTAINDIEEHFGVEE